MGVSYETMIQKMLDELQQAKKQKSDQQMKKHINHVKILCDLILENKSPTTNQTNDAKDIDNLTEEEMIAMVGSNRAKKQDQKKTNYHQITGGDSIFDF